MAVERDKALEMALSQIEKQYGKGSVMKMGEKTSMDVESIATGALSLDIALGIGGLPRGRVIGSNLPETPYLRFRTVLVIGPQRPLTPTPPVSGGRRKEHTWSATRPSTWPWPRSTRTSARAPS